MAKYWLDFLQLSPEEQASIFSDSPKGCQAREVLAFTEDVTGRTWYTRSCFNSEMMHQWLYWTFVMGAAKPSREAPSLVAQRIPLAIRPIWQL